jgi:4-amino-4-deoxy-L-arabinose transferase-like glycosyltransferase
LGRLPAGVSRVVVVASRLLANPTAPVFVLCLILVLSLYARVFDLDQPCKKPCRTPASHTLIFDESYYVNAARVIDGIDPPPGEPYHGAPKGKDPNAEHPQLAKLVMAGAIELFGDGPLGWRGGSVLFGLIALAALYTLVRAAGGGSWLAVGATGVMALDNLLLVHGRIATLDIYAVAMMLIAATFYLRGSPLLAGVALGVGGCMKEVALYLLFALILLEALRAARARWHPAGARGSTIAKNLRPLALCTAATVASFLGILWLLDVLVPAYDPGRHVTYAGNPIAHLSHIYNYALLLKTKPNEHGIASTPWQWLLDRQVIDYARVVVNTVVHRGASTIRTSRALIYFRGEINPFLVFLAIPALFAALASAWRDGEEVAAIGACWCLGVFFPFALGSQISGRVTYIYYMVLVMPGLYLVTAQLFAHRRMPSAAVLGWAIALVYGFLSLYPVRTVL